MDPVIERFSKFFNIDPSPDDVAALESMFSEYVHVSTRDVELAWITYYYFNQSKAIKKEVNEMNRLVSLMRGLASVTLKPRKSSKSKYQARAFFYSKFDVVTRSIAEFERLCGEAKPPVPDRVVDRGKEMLEGNPINIPVSASTIAKGLLAALTGKTLASSGQRNVRACRDTFRKLLGGSRA
jgi:hypothetical protein